MFYRYSKGNKIEEETETLLMMGWCELCEQEYKTTDFLVFLVCTFDCHFWNVTTDNPFLFSFFSMLKSKELASGYESTCLVRKGKEPKKENNLSWLK